MSAVWGANASIVATIEIESDGPELVRLPLNGEWLADSNLSRAVFQIAILDEWELGNGELLDLPQGLVIPERGFIDVVKGSPITITIDASEAPLVRPLVLGFSTEGIFAQVRGCISRHNEDGPDAHVITFSQEKIANLWEGVLVCLVVDATR